MKGRRYFVGALINAVFNRWLFKRAQNFWKVGAESSFYQRGETNCPQLHPSKAATVYKAFTNIRGRNGYLLVIEEAVKYCEDN